MSDEIDEIAVDLKKGRPKKVALQTKDLLSTGSTLLNLALSGKVKGGLYKGKNYWFVGDSDSGKSILTMTCFAEASINPAFKGYRFIHDNAEDGVLMDLSKFFGKAVAEKLEPPGGTRTKPGYSSTIEEFYYHVDDAFEKGVPFIYVLDSMDALDSEDDQKKFVARKAAHRKGNDDVSGSYGVAKAKRNSSGLREMFAKLKKTKSIVIIISQTRDNFVQFSHEKKRASGGNSLKFYAHAQIWTAPIGAIKKKVGNKDRELGINVKVKVKKNRQTGRKTDVTVPIYWAFGIDDIGGCIDYLLEEGHWKKGSGGIDAKEFEVTMRREELVNKIESENLENELRAVVSDVWNEIQAACTLTRKRRY